MKNVEFKKEITSLIFQSSETIKKSVSLVNEISKTINVIIKCLRNSKKVILFGNGGSAADAQHIAAEFVGRFKKNRKSYPAIALTTDSSIITSIANDYSFDLIFSRQCESIVVKGDVVIGISTSGNSKNVKNGLVTAKKRGAVIIGLLGKNGGNIKNVVDIPIIVNSKLTERIQESHRTILHIICEIVEKNIRNNIR